MKTMGLSHLVLVSPQAFPDPVATARAAGADDILANARVVGSLAEALDYFENSDFMRETLGEHIHGFFLKKKRGEWEKYSSTITEWEIKHYLANS